MSATNPLCPCPACSNIAAVRDGDHIRISYSFLHTGKDDMPSGAIQLAVGRGKWTEGGMAEAGWFLVGEMIGGGPIFSRTKGKVTYPFGSTRITRKRT